MTAKLLVVTAEPETVNQDLLTTSKSQSIISNFGAVAVFSCTGSRLSRGSISGVVWSSQL